MDNKFKKMLIIFVAIVIALPLILNFLVLTINFIPSVGDNELMFQSYASYFGGAIGGLATLITIYFTIIKTRLDHKPLLYFNNTSVYYYREISGIDSYFIKQCIIDDDDIVYKAEKKGLLFEFDNVGLYPALNLKLTIINLADFLETAKLLKIDNETLDKLNKSYSKEDENYLSRSLFKQGDSINVDPTFWFESLLRRLIYYYNMNKKNGTHHYNNHAIHGKFKLFDLKVEYKDIDHITYKDVFTLFVRLNDSIQITSKLKKMEPWNIVIEFEKISSSSIS